MKPRRNIVLICHDVRSTHNVGSLLRTAEGLGVDMVYFTGYTPYPSVKNDERLPYIAEKLTKQINKTALGAEKLVRWEHTEIEPLLKKLKADEYKIIGLEQSEHSIKLPNWKTPEKVAIILGREVEGIEAEILARCDQIIEIPMFGKKESFNVVQAAAIALFYCRFSLE